jgi:hypothetical protein
MKKLFFVLCVMVSAFLSNAQEIVVPTTESIAKPTKAVMTFASGTYDTDCDYGNIDYNGEPLRVVKFKNTGTEPLIIKNAVGSCGCTVPTFPKEAILPGEEKSIEIRYATNRPGKIDKRVTITTNEEKEHYIRVIGFVKDAPAAPAPEMAVPVAPSSVIKGGN